VRRLASIVLWSVIAAAFIGPGTVTTAALAGASHGMALLWALGFSIVATLVLQEASARLTAASGRDLARALRESYRHGPGGALVLALVIGAIGLGCAAYEAGNLLGAAAGARLILGLSPEALALTAGALAAVLLWAGAPRSVAQCLALLVALMGVAFLVTAGTVFPGVAPVLRGLVVPTVPAEPAGAGLLVLALVGTTVVPYNLFLGSGLATGQRLSEIRFGLAVAVILGGVISMGIVVVGAAVSGEFSFAAVGAALAARLGPWAANLFGWGLAAAGLSSAVTAPLATALTARGLFGDGADDPRWAPSAWRYRSVWALVLATGVGFGVSGVRPVPAILVAQALNGILLPVAAVFLFLAVNDRRLMGEEALNGAVANLLTAAVVTVTVVLGTSGVLRAGAAALGRDAPAGRTLLAVSGVVVALLALPLGRGLARRRRGPATESNPASG
jgi:Mn2+/Fe2+ NRAMP family transporter